MMKDRQAGGSPGLRGAEGRTQRINTHRGGGRAAEGPRVPLTGIPRAGVRVD